MRMIVRGARLLTDHHTAGGDGLSDVEVAEDGRIARVVPHDDQKEPPATGVLIEAHGDLLTAPFVEPHIHLDTALTAGEPRPNASGTLWEGIVSFPDGEVLLREAVRRGADVVGAIPHFEDTREDGVASLGIAFALAEERGLRVDAHCDEIDDEQSRFVEVLATLALRTGLRERATASHTTAMGSYGGAYSFKLQRLLSRAGINLVSNPFANLNLQGRFDAYPKRRGLTQVKEMLAAGVNVAFGHDDVMDPWNALGTGNPLQTALVGVYAAQLTGADEIPRAFEMVTERAARVLGLSTTEYGITPGAPASFVLLPAESPTEAIRRQVRPRYVVSRGTVLAENPPAPTRLLSWPGEPVPSEVDFRRR
ncbi:amidohydrolase family protein [Streptomyces sp. NPDC059382]|uniref:amidohydrolase family protein n=1 Tax=Streptomyces sp. NPDC059382 TaxID=3346816 RepID=UPI0036C167A7